MFYELSPVWLPKIQLVSICEPFVDKNNLCSSVVTLGWHHKIEIGEGIEKLYRWYLKN